MYSFDEIIFDIEDLTVESTMCHSNAGVFFLVTKVYRQVLTLTGVKVTTQYRQVLTLTGVTITTQRTDRYSL